MYAYIEAFEAIKQNPGTGSSTSLAKLVLSLYNQQCSYSFAECIGNLDAKLTALALRMVADYAQSGETQELRDVGTELCNDLYPHLWEMGQAMQAAREDTRRKWQQEEQDREANAITVAEREFISDAGRRSVPPVAADEMILADDDKEGMVSAYYFAGDWRLKKLNLDQVRAAVRERGTGFIYCAAESSYWLGISLDDKLYYICPEYDARERYLEANPLP
jgi:hypothetical protein